MSLLSLPVELLDHIASFLTPSSHLDFALTCKLFVHLETIKHRLAHHRECFERYRYSTDVKNTTIPALLRAVLETAPISSGAYLNPNLAAESQSSAGADDHSVNDPIAAWHVRSMVFHGCRSTRKDWQQQIWDIKTPVQPLPGPGTSWEDDTEVLTKQELKAVQLLVSKWLEDGSQNFSDVTARLMDDICNGRDEAMKALIVAMCPRISVLTVAKSLYASFEERHTASRHPIRRISHLLRRIHVAGLPMPPGFCSLRRVAISVPITSGNHLECVSPVTVKPLLTLPKLEHLYLHHGGIASSVHDEPLELESKSSNVRSVYFDKTSLTHEEVWDLLQPIKALESLTLEECEWPVLQYEKISTPISTLVQKVIAVHGTHLQSLAFPAMKIKYREDVRFHVDRLSMVPNLKHATINIEDLRRKENLRPSDEPAALNDPLYDDQSPFHWPKDLRLPSLTFLELLGTVVLSPTITATLDATLTSAIEADLMPKLGCIDPRKVQLPMSRTNLGGGLMKGEFSSRREAFPLLCELGKKRGFAVLTTWEEDARHFVPDLPKKTTQANMAEYPR